jgi:GNAT superfamily N-acetyltransferase
MMGVDLAGVSNTPTKLQPLEGFGVRMTQDYDKMLKGMEKATENDYSLAEQKLRQGVKGASFALNTLGNVIGSGARYVNDVIPEEIKLLGKFEAERLKNNPAIQAAKEPAMQGAQYAMNEYGEFAKENPRAAFNIETGFEGLGVVPVGKIVTAGKEVAGKKLASALEKMATPKKVMPDSEQFASMSKAAYDKALSSGEVFGADNVANKFANAAAASKMDKIAGVMDREYAPEINRLMKKYESVRGNSLTIKDIDDLDKELTQLKHSANLGDKPNADLSEKLGDLQNTLRSSVMEAPSGSTLAEARRAWMQKKQMEDVEQIFRNANGRTNEAAIIQTGYRSLAKQARKRGSGWTKEQIAMMDKAAKGGLDVDALKFLSGRMIPAIAGGTGGMGAGAAAYLGNIAAGFGATALQTAKGRKLAESITKGMTVDAPPTRLNKMAQALSPRREVTEYPKEQVAKQLLLPAPDDFKGGGFGSATDEAIANARMIKEAQATNPTIRMGGNQQLALPAPKDIRGGGFGSATDEAIANARMLKEAQATNPTIRMGDNNPQLALPAPKDIRGGGFGEPSAEKLAAIQAIKEAQGYTPPIYMGGKAAKLDEVQKLPSNVTPSTAKELMDNIEQQYGVQTSIAERNAGDIYLSSIKVQPKERNQGLGTKAMQDIIKYADTKGKRITLTPSSDFGGNVNRLKEFYKRLGFVENKGKNKDFSISETFYREPSKVKTTSKFSAENELKDGLSPRAKRDLENPSSWVIRDKSTGEVILETTNPDAVGKANTSKYEVVPIAEHLANLNGQSYYKKKGTKPKRGLLKDESGSMPMGKPITNTGDEDLIKRTIEQWGLTRDPKEAAYILPNGKMIDGSGRAQAGGYTRSGDYYVYTGKGRDTMSGDRVVDHREIAQSVTPEGGISGTQAMDNFINASGAVRYMPTTGASFNFMPTDIQLNQLIKAHKATAGSDSFVGDIYNAKGNLIKAFDLPNPTVQKLKNILLDSYNNPNILGAVKNNPALIGGAAGAGGLYLEQKYNNNK